jgi:hypothetical protein
VIDAQEQTVTVSLPARIAFTERKVNDLQIMAVGIFEIESANAAGSFVGCRYRVRARRSVPTL